MIQVDMKKTLANEQVKIETEKSNLIKNKSWYLADRSISKSDFAKTISKLFSDKIIKINSSRSVNRKRKLSSSSVSVSKSSNKKFIVTFADSKNLTEKI